MKRLGEREAWFAGAVAAFVVLVVGVLDLRHTEAQVPPFPPQGESTLPRYYEIRRLDEAFDRRAWIYAGLAAVALGLAAALALARTPSHAGQRRVFGQAGVAGIVVGVLGAVLLWSHRSNIEPPALAVFAPALTLLAIAAFGGGAARLQRPPPGEQAPAERRPLRQVAIAAIGCTVLTVVLAWIFAAPQDGSCDGTNDAPAWTGPLGWVAVVTAIAAIVLGLAGLPARRWVVALVCLLVNPAALLFMALSTGIAC